MKTKNFKKLRKKCQLRNLLLVALSDGKLDPTEEAFLRKKASDMGINDKELSAMLINPGKNRPIFPKKLGPKISQIYDLVCMMLADGILDERELATCHEIARKMNILPSIVDSVLKDIQRQQNRNKEAVFSLN